MSHEPNVLAEAGVSRRRFMIGIAGLTFPVAALHDTSIQMIERHYARWIADDPIQTRCAPDSASLTRAKFRNGRMPTNASGQGGRAR
jgi:hypothetical protein